MKMSAKSVFATMFGIVVLGLVFLIPNDSRDENEPTERIVIRIGDRPDMDPAEMRQEIVQEYHDEVIKLMRRASQDYPVPYVRTTLSEIIQGIDQKKIVLATVMEYGGSADERRDSHAMFRHTNNGRPMIVLFMMNNGSVVERIAEELGSRQTDVMDPPLMDWYVTLFVHEWIHKQHGHRYDATVTVPIHMQQESEAWFETCAKVMEPAAQQGRFQVPLNLELAYAYACYKASGKDMTKEPWQAFVKYIAIGGPVYEVQILCLPPSFHKSSTP